MENQAVAVCERLVKILAVLFVWAAGVACEQCVLLNLLDTPLLLLDGIPCDFGCDGLVRVSNIGVDECPSGISSLRNVWLRSCANHEPANGVHTCAAAEQ